MRQARFLLNICLIIMANVVQSGALRQEHQKKERHTMSEMMSSATKKQQPYVQSPEKYYFPVSNRQSFKRITAYVWHTKKWINENVISYVGPKNKTMGHIMSLNNRISCVVGISIFGFNTYWKQVFNLMDIKTTPKFKQFLQAKTLNAEKNKSYYQ